MLIIFTESHTKDVVIWRGGGHICYGAEQIFDSFNQVTLQEEERRIGILSPRALSIVSTVTHLGFSPNEKDSDVSWVGLRYDFKSFSEEKFLWLAQN